MKLRPPVLHQLKIQKHKPNNRNQTEVLWSILLLCKIVWNRFVFGIEFCFGFFFAVNFTSTHKGNMFS